MAFPGRSGSSYGVSSLRSRVAQKFLMAHGGARTQFLHKALCPGVLSIRLRWRGRCVSICRGHSVNRIVGSIQGVARARGRRIRRIGSGRCTIAARGARWLQRDPRRTVVGFPNLRACAAPGVPEGLWGALPVAAVHVNSKVQVPSNPPRRGSGMLADDLAYCPRSRVVCSLSHKSCVRRSPSSL